MDKLLKTFLSLLLIMLLSYPALSHLFIPGFFPMHDDTQVARVGQMAKSLKEGQFPVRWVSDLGYGFGYPIFNFYNPLPYYFGAFFNLAGFDVLSATKIMFAFGFLLSGIGMFFLARHFFGRLGGILSALFYLYAPYHAVQFYVRGSLAELWAYGLLPFVFWGLAKRDLFLGGISLALLILSHNLTAIAAFPAVIVLMLILTLTDKRKDRKSLFYCLRWLLGCERGRMGRYEQAKQTLCGLIVSLLIGLALSCFFWLPAIVEKKYTSVDQMVAEKFNPLFHFIYPQQFWNSRWGFGGSAAGLDDGISFQIGKLHLLMSIFALITTAVFWKKGNKKARILLFVICYLLFVIFMMLPISKTVWQIFYPFLSYLQFPWRFLTFTCFACAFLAGSIVFWKKIFKKRHIFFTVCSLLVAVLILLNEKYFVPKYIYNVKASEFLTREKLQWEASSISDEYLPAGLSRPKKKDELFRHKFSLQNGEIKEIRKTSTFYHLEVASGSENILKINTVYFPGWKAWIDGKPVKIEKQDYLINLTIPSGKHEVIVKFTDTAVRTIANFISLLSFSVLILFVVYRRYKSSS